MASDAEKKSVLFICLGNICRSPIAEAVFRHLLKERDALDQWGVDSAAIGDWHLGCPPDFRAKTILDRHGVDIKHIARQIKKDDFITFDYIFGMDESNMRDLKTLAPKTCKAKVELLGKYDPAKVLIIEDPYYDKGDAGFEKCFEQCLRCCRAFLDQVS